VIIANVGLDGYGIWALLFSLCYVVTASDLSLGWTYSKLTAELDARKEPLLLNELIGSGMLVAGGFSSLLFSVVWAGHSWILPTLGVAGPIVEPAAQALFVLILANLVHATLGSAAHVLTGLQRVDLRYLATLTGSAIDFAATLSLLFLGLGLVGMAMGFLIGQVVSAVVAWNLCRRLRPELRLSRVRLARASARHVLSLAIRFQGLVAVRTLLFHVSRFSISALCGTEALGAFHLATRLVHFAVAPATSVVAPLLPAFAKLRAGEERERWNELFVRASKAVALSAAVPLCFVAAFAASILFAWTGEAYALAAWTVRILAPSQFVAHLTSVATNSLKAEGAVRLELTFGLITAVLGVAGIALGYAAAGYLGIVVGLSMGRAASWSCFLWRFAAAGNVSAHQYREAWLPTLGALVPVFAAVWIIAETFGSQLIDGPRWTVLLTLILLAVGFAVVCASVTWRFGLSRAERQSLRSILPGAVNRRAALGHPQSNITD
jgi:O-antigen/teichoic acid export membrane protein